MSNIVTCEGCGAQYDATGYQPGVQFACTNCGTLVTVPTPGIDFADQPAESQYEPGQAVADAANAKLRAHGVRANKKRPGGRPGQGARRQEPPNRNKAGAPKGAGHPAKRGGGQPMKKQPTSRMPAQKGGSRGPAPRGGSRGPAPKGRMANAGGRSPARGMQRGGRAHARDDYYDEEDDYDDYAPKKDNTMLIIGIVAGALILIVVLALVLMGGEDEPVKSDPTKAGEEEKVDSYADIRQYLNNEEVKKVVDQFINAIENSDEITFNSLLDWEKVAGNAQKPVDVVKKYYKIARIKNSFKFFNREIDFQKKYNYYNPTVGRQDNVGYGMWNFTPIGDIGEAFQWTIELGFNRDEMRWKIIKIGKMLKGILALHAVRIAEADEENQEWVPTKYFLDLEQYADYQKNLKIDKDYSPGSSGKYTRKEELGREKMKDDDYGGHGTGNVKVPELIKNVSAGSEYSSKLSNIKSGSLGSSRDFSTSDKNKDIVGELINIIITGAQDGFKMKMSADAALEANKALQKIFDKTSRVDAMEYGFRISKSQDEDGTPVDEDTMKEVVDAVKLWIDLYKQQGWTID